MPALRKPLPPELTTAAFQSARAAKAGASRGVLRGPSVRRLGRGLFLNAAIDPDFPVLVAAQLQVLPSGVTAVDGVTALRLWQIEVGPEQPYRYVTTAGHYSIRGEVRVRRTRELPPCISCVVEPVSALTAARGDLDLVELVEAAEWLVRIGHSTLHEVKTSLGATKGRHCRRAHRAAELVRAGSESTRETRLRLLAVLCGLPEPECNIEIGDARGFIARVDLYLRAWRIALEYEGDQHRTDPETYAKDLVRSEQLSAAGVLTIRVSKEHLKRPRDVANRIYQALLARGYDGPAPVFSAEWCAAFEPLRSAPAA